MNEKFKLTMFIIYTVLFEAMVWGGFGYAFFIKEMSGWWFVPALILSDSQLKPKHFGLPYHVYKSTE